MANKYKVIALSVGGRHNKIYHSGDIVKSEDFHPGHAEMLANQGFLKAISLSKKEAEELAAAEAAAEAEAKAKAEAEELAAAEGKTKELSIADITAKEIKKQLTDLGIEFDKDSSKEDLFALLQKGL